MANVNETKEDIIPMLELNDGERRVYNLLEKLNEKDIGRVVRDGYIKDVAYASKALPEKDIRELLPKLIIMASESSNKTTVVIDERNKLYNLSDEQRDEIRTLNKKIKLHNMLFGVYVVTMLLISLWNIFKN